METWQHGHGHSTRLHLGAFAVCDPSGHQDWKGRDMAEGVRLGSGCDDRAEALALVLPQTCAPSCALHVPVGRGPTRACMCGNCQA